MNRRLTTVLSFALVLCASAIAAEAGPSIRSTLDSGAMASQVTPTSAVSSPVPPGPDIPVPIADGCWTSDNQTNSANGGMSFSIPPANTLDPSLEYSADLHTSLGTIQVELAPRSAPDAVNNFVCLARAGFYDGTPFFRAIPGLLIQGGDPSGTGTGNPGYTFGVDTIDSNYMSGVIAYANSAPDQNGSQFFIAVGDLNGSIATDFPVFGRVIDGMNVVEKIAESNIQATYTSPATNQPGVVMLETVDIIAHPPVSGPFLSPTTEAIATPEPAAGAIELDAKDIAFVPTDISIYAADEPVTIQMKNTGAALHNFSIDALKIDVDVNPGETVEIVIPAGTAPGTYEYYCNVPGHKEAGMVGKLTVK